MPRTPPHALLFDLDGTLVDSLDLILTCFRHAFRTHVGAIPPDDALIAGIGTPLVTQLAEFVADSVLRETMVTTYRSYQMEHHDRLIREFEGARETLELLHDRGHAMAIVTSKAELLAERALEFAGLAEYMDVVVGVESCERHKPDPEPVHVALRALDARPGDAIFVGDSPHDITSGNAAGVITVAALWGPFSRETLAAARPTHFIEHIRDLPSLIEQVA
ncbi:MAG TPA: HAD-IA family hydrolase [Gemmatimonadaceae bacterium]|nr:HAD-IA family hydrolase [Gemmatimonadaceae bacterium]